MLAYVLHKIDLDSLLPTASFERTSEISRQPRAMLHHKNVPVRLRAADEAQAAEAEMNSMAILASASGG